MRRNMRFLAATIGALLISASQPVLAQEPEMGQAETSQPEQQPGTMGQAETPQPEIQPAPEMQQSERQAPAPQVVQAKLPGDPKWTGFLEPSLKTSLDLPSAVFSTPDGAAYRGVGRQFKTPDGRATVAIYSLRNNGRDTPASFLRKNLSGSRPSLDYQRVTRDFYAISGVSDGTIYYSRCNLSRSGGTLHCFDLKYPVQEKAAWDGIVTRMSRSLRPLNRS
jgi:hypothetical protein